MDDYTVCNSSVFSREKAGDIVSIEKRSYFVQQHETININLQITKLTKHVSSFEFEEKYEEI